MPRKPKRCLEVTTSIHAHTVTLDQQGIDRFTVTYGKQVKKDLNCAAAAKEFGACIMHALACDGVLDNRESGEKR